MTTRVADSQPPTPAVHGFDGTSGAVLPATGEGVQSRAGAGLGASLFRAVLGCTGVALLLVIVGRVLLGPFGGSSLLAWDVRSVERLSERRTDALDDMSAFWSRSADAPTIVAIAAVVAVVLLTFRRWREAACLASALGLELGTFLVISYAVGRDRPEVTHLGSVPSTASFPSGHIAASIVLWGFLAVMLRRFEWPRLGQVAFAALGVSIAVAVGWARVYRGMHHPLDVVAGAVMGTGVLGVVVRSTRDIPRRPVNGPAAGCDIPAAVLGASPRTNAHDARDDLLRPDLRGAPR